MSTEETKNQHQNASWLYTPPSSVISPPIGTRPRELPIGSLSWQDFEKLCHRIVRTESDIEYSKLYGTQGNEQEGIDIFARATNVTKYHVYQCKNEQEFSAGKIADAVTKFLQGEWLPKTDVFVLCTRESLRQRGRADEVEKQAQILRNYGVSFQPWDKEELSDRLKSHPEIVDDFFGRSWVAAFCGTEVASSLDQRLDANQLRGLRHSLRSLYDRVFNLHDRGLPIPDAIPLYERYIVPDVDLSETVEGVSRYKEPATTKELDSSGLADPAGSEVTATQQPQVVRRYSQRLPIERWLAGAKRNILFGEPGSGKSTFLRYLSLDLLHQAPSLLDVATKWGDYLPVWIPFALWTKSISLGHTADYSVQGIVNTCLRSWDAEQLIPLVTDALKDKRLLILLDGLDEYASTETAHIAFNHLYVFLGAHDIPVIAATRPHGFDRLGFRRDGWREGTIAPFLEPQQTALAQLWFTAASQKTNAHLEREERSKHITFQVQTFFGELGRSPDLRDLARNPLLLCLLISLQIKSVRLPLRRFDAYASLTDELISSHPQRRRVAAESPVRDELSIEDLKKVLAHLATVIHTNYSEGLIAEETALSIIEAFCRDDQHGLGMTKYAATQASRKVLAGAEAELGILVKRSRDDIGFFHRTIQEYLVSYNLLRLTLEEQKKILSETCANPLWREVILGLFQITNRPGDVEQLIRAIRQKSVQLTERQGIEDLLAEVAFGSFNCPPKLAKELSEHAIKEIEFGVWLPHRERLLRHALDGLRSPVTAEILRQKLQVWFPNRPGFHMEPMYRVMADWNPAEDAIAAAFNGLHSEDYAVTRQAARTLARLAAGDDEMAMKLENIANYNSDPYIVAAATEALLEGWQSRQSVRTLVDRCAQSSVSELRVLGIRGRIALGIHRQDDRDALLQMAHPDIPGNYWMQEELADLLLAGWPRDESLKKRCVKAAEEARYHQAQIQRDIALSVLLRGYPMDEEIVAFCTQEILNERYPFNGLNDFRAFRVLAENFREHQAIVEALDKWAESKDHLDMELSEAALVGRTPLFKAKLLEALRKDSFPHWPAGALLEGWGMSDPDVTNAFQEVLAEGPAKLSAIAHLLPRIILDSDKCRSKLLELLQSPECERADFVLSGLIQLGVKDTDKEVVDAGLTLIEHSHRAFLGNDVFKGTFIEHYNFDPRIRELALQTLSQRADVYASVAKAFESDEEIRKSVLALLHPLPVSLRQVIAFHLSQIELDDELALFCLRYYDYDRDPEVKLQAGIGYYTRLSSGHRDTAAALDTLAKDIIAVGPDYQERRLAAFCGLVILDRIDLMDVCERFGERQEKIKLHSIRSFDTNIPYLRFLLKNWKRLKSYFGDDFWPRLFYSDSIPFVWDHLSKLADEYPEPREEALDFFRAQEPKVAKADSLNFLARAQSESDLLLEYSLNTLGLSASDRPAPTPSPMYPVSITDQLVAAEILASRFHHRSDVPAKLYARKKPLQFNQLVLALDEAWPNSDELKLCFDEMARERQQYWDSTYVRYQCARASRTAVYKLIRRIIRIWARHRRSRPYEIVAKPIVRRLRQDRELTILLLRHISAIGTPSEKVSMSRLLSRAGGMADQLKDWAESELGKQFSGSGIETGFDITTGEVVSLPHAIYQVLQV